MFGSLGLTLGLVAALARAGGAALTEPSASQDEAWQRVKDVRLGPVSLTLGGQLRLRYEYDDGFSLKGYAPGEHDQLLLERTRFDVGATFWQGPRLAVQLQDAHDFLTRYSQTDFPVSNPIEDSLDLRQLYAEWLRIGASPIGVRVGRQQIAYGDQRVFGPGGWGNTGRYAWEAAMLKLDTEWLWADLWLGRPLVYQPAVWPNDTSDALLTFAGYAGVKGLPMRLEAFYVVKHEELSPSSPGQGATEIRSTTIGMQAEGAPLDHVDAAGTFAAQLGRHEREQLRAFGANAKLGVTFPIPTHPRVGMQYTWGSGDSEPNDGVHETFDGVYGGRDIFFYGYLNLFAWANLHDAELDVSVEPYPGLELHAAYHRFSLDRAKDAWYTTAIRPARLDPTGAAGTSLGDELDARVVLSLWHHLELMAGFGHYVPGSFVRTTGPAAAASWGFGQATYSW